MAWAKRKAMSWEWFAVQVREIELAERLTELANARHKIMFVLPSNFVDDVLVVSCKGTPLPKEPKAEKKETPND